LVVAAALGFAGLALGGRLAGAATVTIRNTDAPGWGLGDPTAVIPVGGNLGTTVGDQRMNVFMRAGQLWGDALESAPAIVVDASFAPLPCGTNQVMLGHATATSTRRNSRGSPPDTWVPIALANALAGTDLNGAEAEIQATFNGALSSCAMGLQDWYYGFDGQAGNGVDLLAVVLHELGHGLGFASVINPANGVAPNGALDAFARHVYDNGTSVAWTDMTDAERATSAQNARHLVWDGKNVSRQAAQILAFGSPTLTTDPVLPGLVGNISEANFGPLVSSGLVSGPLMVGTLAKVTCKVTNFVTNGIVLLTQSDICPPVQMAFNAQDAGALAVLIMDPFGVDPPYTASVAPSLQTYGPVTIPVVSVSSHDATIFNAAFDRSNVIDPTLVLSATATQQVGTDGMGRTLLFASSPVQETSTLSHWDPLARPDLLMEPEIGSKATHDRRMELAVFRDMGWHTVCGNGTVDSGEECDLGDQNGAPGAACNADCTTAQMGGGGGVVGLGTGGALATGNITGGAGGGVSSGGGPPAGAGGVVGRGGQGTGGSGIVGTGANATGGGGGGCACDMADAGLDQPAVFLLALVGVTLAACRRRPPAQRRVGQ
jgi:hypothetical protein